MAQQQNNGNGNTIVQIEGDGNHVVIGHPHLTLTRYESRRQISSEASLLSPYTRSIPLFGRERELANLHDFLNDKRPLLCRVLIGGGGSGKTRLALELCDQAEGWNAGFVAHAELKRFISQQNLSDWGWQKPTLIVVDYSAGQSPLLAQWLEQLADRTHYPHPLRRLLLERHADTQSGWWHTVFDSGGYGADSKRALLDPPEPVALPPLLLAENRLELLQAMLQQIDGALLLPADDPDFRAKLMQIPWGGDPLYLMMAALGASKLGYAEVLALSRTDLADYIAGHEEHRLLEMAHALNHPALLPYFAACVTLAQGMSRDEFLTFAAKELAILHRSDDAASLADLLQEAFPRGDGIAPLQPDLIGEALILRTLKQNAGKATVLRCYAAFGQPVAETLIRCAQDFAPQQSAPLQWLEALVQKLGDDEAALGAMLVSLPVNSVVLIDLNLQVMQRLQELCAANTHPLQRVARLTNLSYALAKANQLEPAYQSILQAMSIVRELVSQQPDDHIPELAETLCCLTIILSELGKNEHALSAALEATRLFRELSNHTPEDFRKDLALSLLNLAPLLSKSGQHESALLVAREAVENFRVLAELNPVVFREKLSASLNNLANAQGILGQLKPALLSIQEAVVTHRELAAQFPDMFLPDLASLLYSLANILGVLGQHSSALTAAQESVEIRRKLAVSLLEVFRADLASSLIVCAEQMCAMGAFADALPLAREAIATLLPAFLQYPEAHGGQMHRMLGVYLQLCESTGQALDYELLDPLEPYFTEEE